MYYVMEFVSGMDLQHLLRRNPPGAKEILRIIRQVCEALQYAHERGIVHRDIKPANILFTREGTIKLGDFGVANRLGGTNLYMPPELLLGERTARTDPRVDVYDDVNHWDQTDFTELQEFYNDFNDYDFTIHAPAGFVVWSTGELKNENDTSDTFSISRLYSIRSMVLNILLPLR